MKQTSTRLQRFNSFLFLFLLTISIHNAEAQCTSTCGANLIPNPSFETTTTYCGSTGILYTDKSPVQSWFGVSASTGSSSGITPDNFNDNCAGNSTDNCGDGSGSVGFFTTGARESVQAKLNSPLIAGHKYCFSMKVLSNFPNTSSDGIGAWFHNKGKIDIDAMNGGNSFLGAGTTLNASPQVQNPSNTMIGGTCKTVTGTFCATGGEQWIVISNFRTNANTHITGINGYLVIDELSLKEADCLVITSITTTSDSVCPGACATLKANPTGGGGAGSYTYLWSPGGETTQSISACPTTNATEYKCTVSSSMGCSATIGVTDSITLYFKKYLPTPTITTSGTTTLCSGDSVKLTCSAAPNYLWSPGNSPKQSITVGTAGVYTVTVKHPYSGCNTTSASTTVKINALPSITITGLVNTPSSCDVNDGSIKGAVATGVAPLSYSWNSTPVQPTPDLVNVGPGTYVLTVTDGNGCKKTISGTIVNKPAPNPPTLKAGSPAICVGTNTILYVTGADPTYTYTWTDPLSNQLPSNDTVFINNAQLKDGGVYKVTATKFGCTGASTSLTLTVNALPVIDTTTLISHETSCGLKDGSITGIKVTGAPILKYAWDGGPQTTTTPDLTGAGIGTHTLVVTDGNGCVQSTTGKVWNKDTPDSATVKATSAVICEGLKTILFVNPSDPTITYTWITPSGDKILNDSIILLKTQIKDAGTYTITATKSNCTSLPTHATLIVNPAAIGQKITVTKSTICEGDTTILDAAVHIPGTIYNIYQVNGPLVGPAPQQVFPKVDTKYYMEATTGSDCRQLTTKDTITVIVNPAPEVPPPIASNTTICEGGSTIINVTAPVTGVTYNVYDANGKLLGTTPFTVTLKTTTTFYIEAVTANGCKQVSAKKPITITVNPTPAGPKISVTGSNNNYICDGSSAILTSSIPTGIKWLPDNQTTSTITVTKAGTYSVYFTDVHGCVSLSDSVAIKINPTPKVDISNYGIDTVRCNATIGGIHGIVINSGTAPFTYNWFETGDPTKTVSTNLILQGVASGKYTLIVTDKNGCTAQVSNIFIPTKGGIVAHLFSNPNTGFYPLSGVLTTNTSGVGKPIDYVWYLDGHLIGTTDNKTNTFPFKDLPFGEHVFQVSVRDTNGCKSVDYITIFVNSGIHFEDVNIFTPNNDGKNDILIFPTEGIKTMHGKIYDRWGLKLFEWSDVHSGWDGKAESGGDVPEGTYYYIINYTDIYDGPPHTKSGFFQLMRK